MRIAIRLTATIGIVLGLAGSAHAEPVQITFTADASMFPPDGRNEHRQAS
jgi:hypothetical protein